MKKVGIITTFRQSNWGSVLQAYSLQKVVERLGYDVELIDYIYPNEFHWERGLLWGKTKKKSLITLIKDVKFYILCRLHWCAHSIMFLLNDFISKNMRVSKKFLTHKNLHSNPPIYDIYISGSDQIWNPNTMKGDFSYMLDFAPVDSQKIAYASSFSCLSIPEEYVEEYRTNLSKFSSISVRENNGKKVIKQLLGKDVDVVLDPTLLLNREEWAGIAEKADKIELPKQYILCYMLSYTFAVEEPMAKLLDLVQKKYKMPIITLNRIPAGFKGDVEILPKNYNKGIYEFLYLIKNATIVVTSSFHGTAFSLNFGKPFFALAASNEDDRLCSLLKSLDMTDILIDASCISVEGVEPFYDIDSEQKKLDYLRNESLEYLKKSLF